MFHCYSVEIEALLLTHPKIKDTGVVGVPNEFTGEEAFAFVVLQPGETLSEEDVIDYVAGNDINARS